jgi:anti-anti-sigma factor
MLRYLAEIDGPAARVALRGRLDVDTVWSFGAELSALIRAGRRHLTIDLGDLEHVASICVGVLNRTVAELKARSGTLTLSGADDALLGRLRDAGMHTAVRTPRPFEAADGKHPREQRARSSARQQRRSVREQTGRATAS